MAEPIMMPFWAWTVEGPGTVFEVGGLDLPWEGKSCPDLPAVSILTVIR